MRSDLDAADLNAVVIASHALEGGVVNNDQARSSPRVDRECLAVCSGNRKAGRPTGRGRMPRWLDCAFPVLHPNCRRGAHKRNPRRRCHDPSPQPPACAHGGREPVGPTDRRVWKEAQALVGSGHDVVVVSPRGSVRDTGAYERRDGVEIHRYPQREAGGGPWSYFVEYGWALWHIRRLARRLAAATKVRVVQLCNPPDILFLAVLSLRRRGARIVFDHHDLVPELFEARFGARGGLLYRLAALAESRAFRIADVVLSPNESYQSVAVDRGGKEAADVFVVRMAPDPSGSGPASPIQPQARQTVSDRLRGHDRAAGRRRSRAAGAAVLAERRDDWHAIFAGSGDAADDARVLASRAWSRRPRRVRRLRRGGGLHRVSQLRRRVPRAGAEERAQRRLDDDQGRRVHGPGPPIVAVRPSETRFSAGERGALRDAERRGGLRRVHRAAARRSRVASAHGGGRPSPGDERTVLGALRGIAGSRLRSCPRGSRAGRPARRRGSGAAQPESIALKRSDALSEFRGAMHETVVYDHWAR